MTMTMTMTMTMATLRLQLQLRGAPGGEPVFAEVALVLAHVGNPWETRGKPVGKDARRQLIVYCTREGLASV